MINPKLHFMRNLSWCFIITPFILCLMPVSFRNSGSYFHFYIYQSRKYEFAQIICKKKYNETHKAFCDTIEQSYLRLIQSEFIDSSECFEIKSWLLHTDISLQSIFYFRPRILVFMLLRITKI